MRRTRLARMSLAVILALAGGVVFQLPSNCNTFGATLLVSAVDFCSILDCQNGVLGGLIRPCGSPTSVADDLLADCQNFVDADDGNP